MAEEKLDHCKGGMTVNWQKVNRLKVARRSRFSFYGLESDFSTGEHRWVPVRKTARQINREKWMTRQVQKIDEAESELEARRILFRLLDVHYDHWLANAENGEVLSLPASFPG